MYSLEVLSAFTLLCNLHHHTFTEFFLSSPMETLYWLNPDSPSPLSQFLATTMLLSSSMNLTPIGTSYNILFILFWLAYFTESYP